MKIIDLLNRIANGLPIPKKVKYTENVYIYNEDAMLYEYVKDNNILFLFENPYGLEQREFLNDEIKILENNTISITKDDYISTDLGSFKGRRLDIAFALKLTELENKIKDIRGSV